MKLFKNLACAVALPLAAMLVFPGAATAQEAYPARALKLVVPYPPGASTDNLSRAFAQELGKELHQSVVVENKPGASTAIAALAVKNAPADGYTLLFQTDGLYNAKLAAPTTPYEYGDFEIISPLAQTSYALITPASLELSSLADLAAHAKKSGELTFAILGVGPNQYTILGETLARAFGVKARLIPYKGGMEGLTAVMTGDVDAYLATVSLAQSQKNNSKVKLLALTSERETNRYFPGLKSFEALGVGGMVFRSLFGVAIRSGTPPEVKARLSAAVSKVADSDNMKAARTSIALEDFCGSLDDYKREVEATQKMYEDAQVKLKTVAPAR